MLHPSSSISCKQD